MSSFRIALANLRIPENPEDALVRSLKAIEAAGTEGAELVCFPECYVPGYRCWPGRATPPPDRAFLEGARAAVCAAARASGIGVALGTERFVGEALRLTVLVVAPDGSVLGAQDKVQLDPSEDQTYQPGSERRLFEVGALRFGIAICHEGFRYPETVRWAARRGAQLVLHPHYSEAEPGGFLPSSYGDPRNSFHEQAVRCRAAENGCYVATINCASPGSPTTSAVAGPDGTVLRHQPHGEPGLLVMDLDLDLATCLLARRYRGGLD